MSDDRKGLNIELIECAKYNFENLEKDAPQLKAHPLYKIAKAQLDEGLGYQSVEESLRFSIPKEIRDKL